MLPYDKKLKGPSRELRKNMTEAERCFWSRVRRKQLGWFYRQKPIGRYIVDFFYPKARLGIKVDGGQHFSGEAKAYDRLRDGYMSSLGLKVLRFTNSDVM